MVMNLDNDIRAPRDGPREVVAPRQRNGAWRPSADESDAGNSGPAEAGIAAVCTGRAPARSAIQVHENQGVMDNPAIVGPELNAAHINVLIEVQWQNEASKLVGAIGRQRIL